MTDWFPFEKRQEHDFEDEHVVSCYLGKLFQFCEKRNAWPHPPFEYGLRTHYPGDESFCPDLVSAKEKPEDRRKQGSVWVIRELPVIVISGGTRCLVVGEINTGEPLFGFIPLRKKLLSLQDHGLHFEPRSEDAVFRIVCQRDRVPPAELPFYEHHSDSRRGYPLGWDRSVAHYDLRAVLRVICRVNKCVQREASLTTAAND